MVVGGRARCGVVLGGLVLVSQKWFVREVRMVGRLMD